MAPNGKGKKVQNINDESQDVIEVDGDDNDRASWDSYLHKTFIRLCVDEKEKGNMPTTHFSSQGWENIATRFLEETKKSYTRGQLKNHWDRMRKEWQAWIMIKSKATGLGWDPEKKTPVASKTWWDKMAKVNKRVLPFKKRGLEHEEDYFILFSHATATGDNAWAPSQGLPTEEPYVPQQHDQTSGYNDISLEETRNDEDEDEYEQMQSPENEFQVDESEKRQRRASIEGQSIRKRKRLTGADKICESFDRIATHMERRSTATMSIINGISVKETLKVLNQVPGVIAGSPLWLFACRLFSKPYNRELFINIEDNDLRLIWLKDMELREPPVNSSQQLDHFSGGFTQLLAQSPTRHSQLLARPSNGFARFA